MLYLIIGIIGIILGFASAWVILLKKSVGSLRIETSDFDGPFIFLELVKGVNYLWSKKFVILEIKRESYISRK